MSDSEDYDENEIKISIKLDLNNYNDSINQQIFETIEQKLQNKKINKIGVYINSQHSREGNRDDLYFINQDDMGRLKEIIKEFKRHHYDGGYKYVLGSDLPELSAYTCCGCSGKEVTTKIRFINLSDENTKKLGEYIDELKKK